MCVLCTADSRREKERTRARRMIDYTLYSSVRVYNRFLALSDGGSTAGIPVYTHTHIFIYIYILCIHFDSFKLKLICTLFFCTPRRRLCSSSHRRILAYDIHRRERKKIVPRSGEVYFIFLPPHHCTLSPRHRYAVMGQEDDVD